MTKKRYKERMHVYYQVRKAVRKGVIMKSEACERCSKTGIRLDAHHADHTKPLEVEWICRSCHALETAKTRKPAKKRRNIFPIGIPTVVRF